MIVKLLNEHHLEFLSLTGGCRGSSESTLVNMPNCWKSHAAAHIIYCLHLYFRHYVVTGPEKSPYEGKTSILNLIQV